jgi:hypothetical protein
VFQTLGATLHAAPKEMVALQAMAATKRPAGFGLYRSGDPTNHDDDDAKECEVHTEAARQHKRANGF